MCGICLLLSLTVSVEDRDVITKMQKYIDSFEDKDKEKLNKKLIQMEKGKICIEGSFEELIKVISNRGPDHTNVIDMCLKTNDMHENNQLGNASYEEVISYLQQKQRMLMISSVLSLRGGTSITKQPIYKDDSNVLLYNGEIYLIDGKATNEGYDLIKDNDGLILFEMLNKRIESFNSMNNQDRTKDNYATNVFDVINRLESDHAFVYIDKTNKTIIVNKDLFGKKSLILVYIKSSSLLMITSALPKAIYQIRAHEEVTVLEVPNNALVLIDYSTSNSSHQKLFFYLNKLIQSPSCLRFNDSIEPISKYCNLTKECYQYLSEAVNKRISNLPQMNQLASQLQQAFIGVLFSGGIDSLLLAYFTIVNSPSFVTVDLFNLSFDKQNAPDRNSGIIAYKELLMLFPHRSINLVLIDKSFKENVEEMKAEVLQLIYPRDTHMDFNISTALKFATKKEGYKVNSIKLKEYFENNSITLIENVHSANYNNNILSKQIEKIDYEGFIEKTALYTSPALIILSGLGADELFGGYSRYKNGNLIEQMAKDIDRIWIRNFGRDDRSCADNGIELRFPFFDYDLLYFLASIKDMSEVTNFQLKRGFGEKRLLRNVARLIGFNISSQFEKRAIQFGTKLAHETNINKYGSNRKANGKAQFD